MPKKRFTDDINYYKQHRARFDEESLFKSMLERLRFVADILGLDEDIFQCLSSPIRRVTVSYLKWIHSRKGYFFGSRPVNRMMLRVFDRLSSAKEMNDIIPFQAAYVFGINKAAMTLKKRRLSA